MGIPKFFRYFSERYPCIINSYDGDTPMHFDNLYLDMNGIIHNCSHGNAPDLTKVEDNDAMARSMCAYIEKLYDAVKPQKNFVLCVDGVAPRAKMNQQRQRRFRKEHEALDAYEEALKEGKTDVKHPDEVFDSNAITPGTPFMTAFDKHFRYFIQNKMNTDPSWQVPTVTFSGHDVPGEGEHKVMDFIRARRMKDGYDSNETHCLYGLDADLIMLAMVAHEPHFVLLREVVKFQTKKEQEKEEAAKKRGLEKEQLDSAPTFVLLHIEAFRNYLMHDFSLLHDAASVLPPEILQKGAPAAPAPQRWNPVWERVENDFVVMSFLVGNDFLPGFPTLSINSAAMPECFQIYNDVVLQEGLYLADGKAIDWGAMQHFMAAIGEQELRMIQEQEKAQREYNDRQRKFDPAFKAPPVPRTENIETAKTKHYISKLGFGEGDGYSAEKVAALCRTWVEGVEWTWRYYTEGVPSWTWYFPHHYAPYAGDVGEYLGRQKEVTIEFDGAAPLAPFQQLLGVLPPLSIKRCLPKAFWNLPQEPHLQYAFPERIAIDREKARAPWEGIVLIPFLKHDDILSNSIRLDATLTEEERARNSVGQMREYKFDPTAPRTHVKASIKGCEDIVASAVAERMYTKTDYVAKDFLPVSHPGAKPGGAAGFAALANNPYFTGSVHLNDNSSPVTLFDRKSFNQSIILSLKKCAKGEGELEELEKYRPLLGEWVWADWPHLRPGRVVAVSTRFGRLEGKGEFAYCTPEETQRFDATANGHANKLLQKRGIDLTVTVLMTVAMQCGLTLHRTTHRLAQNAGVHRIDFPAQLVLRQPHAGAGVTFPSVRDLGMPRHGPLGGMPVAYVPKKPAFKNLLGCKGQVKKETDTEVKVVLQPPRAAPAFPPGLAQALDVSQWKTFRDVAAELRKRHKMDVAERNLQLAAGSIRTNKAYGEVDMGLALLLSRGEGALARLSYATYRTKARQAPVDVSYYMTMGTAQCAFSKMSARPGASGRPQKDGKGTGGGLPEGRWYLSPLGVETLIEYARKFPQIVEAVGNQSPDYFDPNQLRMSGNGPKPHQIVTAAAAWVKEQPHMEQPLIAATEETVPVEALRGLEDSLIAAADAAACEEQKPVSMMVTKPIVDGYLPLFSCQPGGQAEGAPRGKRCMHFLQPPRHEAERLAVGARVVNLKPHGAVPFCARGVVSRLLDDNKTVEVVFDDEHLGCTTLGGRLRTYRGALVKSCYLLSLSAAEGAAQTAAPKHPQETRAQKPRAGSESHAQQKQPKHKPNMGAVKADVTADVHNAPSASSRAGYDVSAVRAGVHKAHKKRKPAEKKIVVKE